ncbi:MAG: class I SAM-dependent methyltransferase [Anaerolineae bacterium]
MANISDLTKTASHWDSNPWQTDSITYWAQLPAVQQQLSFKESGRVDSNWIDYTLAAYLTDRVPMQRCLSLGCGEGRVERQWAERQAFLACDAYDIAPGSIADAARAAADAGYSHIHYAVADIETIELPAQAYDVAWAVSAAHHFSQLEHVFTQVAQALKPDGLFILHEYVGANRFQFPARQREIIDACLRLLPVRYRLFPAPTVSVADNRVQSPQARRKSAAWVARRIMDKIREGSLLSTTTRYWRKRQALQAGQRPMKEVAIPTERSVIAVDPSEAIRSNDILPVLENFFDIVEYRPLGGSILQFLLADIAGNFEDVIGQQWLEIFFQIEDTLQATGDISSDFAYIVAKPKQSALKTV